MACVSTPADAKSSKPAIASTNTATVAATAANAKRTMLTVSSSRPSPGAPPPSTTGAGDGDRFAAARALTRALAAPLSDADASAQSMPDASPAKWHLAHTTWFFETFVLVPHAPGYRRFDERYDYLFNSYYETLGPRIARHQRGLMTRPSLADVLAYRDHVDGALDRARDDLGDASALIALGLAHEAQHQELLLTDILHLFAHNPLEPAMFADERDRGGAPPLAYRSFEGGRCRIGGGDDGDAYVFDAERPAHDVLVAPFELAQRLVSNAEWDAFIADGGYREPLLWLSDGWSWVTSEAITAPLYWREDAAEFTLAGLRPRDPDAPVAHVSHFEADAFARWAGARLPTEYEWETAARSADGGAENANLLRRAGFARPRRAPAGGGMRLMGDCWQWTASAFLPYPGFRPVPGAVGEYNGKFMSGQMVLRGGSCATPAGSVSLSTRNFFPPTARWQFSGVRLARDA